MWRWRTDDTGPVLALLKSGTRVALGRDLKCCQRYGDAYNSEGVQRRVPRLHSKVQHMHAALRRCSCFSADLNYAETYISDAWTLLLFAHAQSFQDAGCHACVQAPREDLSCHSQRPVAVRASGTVEKTQCSPRGSPCATASAELEARGSGGAGPSGHATFC